VIGDVDVAGGVAGCDDSVAGGDGTVVAGGDGGCAG
jgi:hypothetical protein